MNRRLARTTALLPLLLAALFLLPTAPASAANLGERTLSPGMEGKDVGQLQTWLKRLGLPVERTKDYDKATERAIRRWEREQEIDEDALIPREQARKMRRDARPRRKHHEYASRTLKRGRSGTDVRALQRYLIDHGVEVEPDGAYGPRTEKAVRTLERRVKTKVDGKVTRTEARAIRATAPRPQVFGVATPSVDTENVEVASGSRVFPINGDFQFGDDGAHFGDRGGAHRGEDIFADCGTPLVAAESGTVVFKATDDRAGYYVVIRGAQSGEDHVYMHLDSAARVSKGDTVKVGERIGDVGDSGNAQGCHLHFEIWTKPGWYTGGEARDPMPDLKAWRSGAEAEASSGR